MDRKIGTFAGMDPARLVRVTRPGVTWPAAA